jgi:hypothetical protein
MSHAVDESVNNTGMNARVHDKTRDEMLSSGTLVPPVDTVATHRRNMLKPTHG